MSEQKMEETHCITYQKKEVWDLFTWENKKALPSTFTIAIHIKTKKTIILDVTGLEDYKNVIINVHVCIPIFKQLLN